MENVILIVHLLLALGLIGVVLLQRSEGGGLGIGGGGGAMSQRAPLTALGKLTWILAVGFIITSITLTIIAAQNASGSSILDRLGTQEPATDAPAPAPGFDGIDPNALVPPPSADGGDADAPLVPRAD
ncbi:preprotein translocase subunit SecG [Mameliella sp. AT18]|uniref:preprotein translocase subunit SecG n=1 Tax=Mameliella sp. AT18 TaxID=3028385 RepID=UPI0008411AAE|nr:preprotein translocase subunit SecG [Mameliella sp. AT18]MDD9729921.1 preprotein translocase subunit SecG [Mameliella sp. AT18]ODM48940.1 preprotein translocase subunit SecG [Ruegeria sp. PBVC088]